MGFFSILCRCQVSNPREATLAKVVPTANNGSSELVRVREESGEVFFIFQKLKFTFDEERKLFRGVEFPADRSYRFYLDYRGHEDEEELAKTRRHFGDNK